MSTAALIEHDTEQPEHGRLAELRRLIQRADTAQDDFDREFTPFQSAADAARALAGFPPFPVPMPPLPKLEGGR